MCLALRVNVDEHVMPLFDAAKKDLKRKLTLYFHPRAFPKEHFLQNMSSFCMYDEDKARSRIESLCACAIPTHRWPWSWGCWPDTFPTSTSS